VLIASSEPSFHNSSSIPFAT
jgi:hypothetical protein